MKKFTLLLSCIAVAFAAVAQAPRYALFEEFTNSSCPPCAAQNPGFEANILNPNPSTVRQISYHVNWPSPNDPMYLADETDINSRISFYNVTGVPDVVLMGNVKENGPSAFTQSDVDDITSQTSPVKVRVSDVDNGTSHTVTVVISSVGAPPAGTFKLRNVIIERNYNWSNPGGNGETYFPNVCRKMLPSATGDDITLASMGSDVTFTYTYDEDPTWVMSEIGVVSFIQNTSTKEIINCGASFDADASIADPAILTHAGSNGAVSSFDVSCTNYGSATSDFSFTLTGNAPADWTSNFVVNGVTYTSSATVSLAANASATATINVTPTSSVGIGTYTLTVTSIDNPLQDPVSKSVYVFNGITDLIVNGAGSEGDQSGTTPDSWQANYVNGLIDAGCTTSSVIAGGIAERASSESSLTGVQNIYYNVGWSFPAFTDSWVAQLEALMNSGVNLFISGQDIGWDTWTDPSASGHATAASQDFYTNYLFSSFSADGGSTNNLLTPVTADPIFGGFSNMALLHYYGSTYFYPDEIAPVGVGTAIFNYSSSTKVAGVKADNGTFKVVYLAPGLEMLSALNGDAVMKATYDWFHGITGVAGVKNTDQSLGINFPNPSDKVTYISVSGLKGSSTLNITNAIGQVIMSMVINEGTQTVEVNTSAFPQGIYRYYLTGQVQSLAHSLEVIH